jgi:small redox-active disulfide protein 2
MSKVMVEVLGPEPPCKRCLATLAVVRKVVEELGPQQFEVRKIDAFSNETIGRYGLVITPGLAVNQKIRISGRIPTEEEVKRILKETIDQ